MYLRRDVSKVRYRFEGPFDSSYSLAILNREMARAVETLRPGTVTLHSTEGQGDYPPNQAALQDDPLILELWQRDEQQTELTEVVLRNLYPPRVADMSGHSCVMNMYGWEESRFPANYVAAFNQYLDVVTVMSEFVRKVLIDSGVRVPVIPVGVGVDHILRYGIEPVTLPEDHDFCFLHISSCFPRKGIDVLLQAYATAFNQQNNVLLVIKTFPNPHNTVEQQIQALKKQYPYCPAIHLINEEMTIAQLNSLYQQANAFVAPSRGEGFGMPMAEAMLWDVPVITTGFGGQIDFCTEKTSWLVDYQFAIAQSHVTQQDALWVEPNRIHLASVMREIYDLSQYKEGRGVIQTKVAEAKATIQSGWRWSQVAQRLLAVLDTLPEAHNEHVPNVAWVSTWNTRCGIATYSQFLLEHITLPVTVFANLDSDLESDDEVNVCRCWRTTSSDASPSLDVLAEKLLVGSYSDIVIQFNFGFFDLMQLQQLLARLQERDIAIIIVFHATKDVIRDGQVKKSLRQLGQVLRKCKRLLVHSVDDINRLKRFGLVNNLTLFPHGVFYDPSFLAKPKLATTNIRRLAAYGFLLPDKGIPELIEAFLLLRRHLETEGIELDVRLELYNALYPANVSSQEWERCVELIRCSEYRPFIHLDTTFHKDEETLQALANCDAVIFPYQQSRESASGAIRLALASGCPVICTPLAIFDDVKNIVHKLPGFSPQLLAEGLYHLLNDDERLHSQVKAQYAWLEAHAWQRVVGYLESMLHYAY